MRRERGSSARVHFIVLVIFCVLCGCFFACKHSGDAVRRSNGPGFFLGAEARDLSAILERSGESYGMIFLEPELFGADDIKKIHASDTQVFGYLNLGAIENFRSYYSTYEDLTFAPYENWEEERWIDASDPAWQRFMLEDRLPMFVKKGFHGVFFDNLDVYAMVTNDKKAAMYEALSRIIREADALGLKVVINGADEFLAKAAEIAENGDAGVLPAIYGYNQECIFSDILDYANDEFGRQDAGMSRHYKNLAAKLKSHGVRIFLLEYTKDAELIRDISEFCEENGYYYFCADNVELKI